MWSKIYPVMWVSVKGKEKRAFSISFPIPLSLLDELIDSTVDLLSVIKLFTPNAPVSKITSGEKKYVFTPEALKVFLEAVRTTMHSLKKDGSYDLVDVATNEVQVLVKIL
ncbi:hypothetical protein [Anaerocolumna jejuensis]|uniref:hypothetical protein n=1 Tax=Anaerocolumna jejuensis TaxID=259063 RepID=UPI003F7CA6FF